MRVDEFLKAPIETSELHKLAMELICIVKYGSVGGTATNTELRLVKAHLAVHVPSLRPVVKLAPPAVKLAPPAITIKVPK